MLSKVKPKRMVEWYLSKKPYASCSIFCKQYVARPHEKNKRTSRKPGGVNVGDISNISGNVNVAGGNITTHQTKTGLSAAEIKQLFDGLYNDIDARAELPKADKEDIKAEVQEINPPSRKPRRRMKKLMRAFCRVASAISPVWRLISWMWSWQRWRIH